MSETTKATLSRRSFLAGSSLIVSFSMLGGEVAWSAPAQPIGPPFGDLNNYPYLDSWIGIDETGAVTVYSGKAELGQGVETAFLQCAAEQLAVEPQAITMLMASTTRMLNEGYTAGSDSMTSSATAIFHAAAQVRDILLGWAANELEVDVGQLKVNKGIISAPNGQVRRYGDLVKGRSLHVQASSQPSLIPPDQYKIVGTNFPRLDIPRKLTGQPIYVQDMHMDNMAHARVVRPPNYASTLISVDTAAAEKMPGVIKVVHENNYLAVIAEGEYQAVLAMRVLQQAAQWRSPKILPDKNNIFPLLKRMTADTKVLDQRGSGAITGGNIADAAYTRPYMMHASIGPSCAIGLFDGSRVTV
jgi:nicotinate dehydrogenase subunit B